MSVIDLTVVMKLTGETVEIECDDKETVGKLVTEIAKAVQLPLRDTKGAIGYKVVLARTGMLLDSHQSLHDAGVRPKDQLTFWGEPCAGCFAPSTRILLASGDAAPLRALRYAAQVLAFDPEQRRYVSAEVEGVLEGKYTDQLVVNGTLVTTPDQQFLLEDGGWLLAKDLRLGDYLLGFPFREVEIASLDRTKTPQPMISLTLPPPLCFVAEGVVARDLIGKQGPVPRPADVFLSYSGADRNHAHAVFRQLEQKGATVFLAERSIPGGERWEKLLLASLRGCRHFWVLCSTASMRSEWVLTECAAAWVLGKRILPILVGLCPEELPERLRAYQTVQLASVDSAIASVAPSQPAKVPKGQ